MFSRPKKSGSHSRQARPKIPANLEIWKKKSKNFKIYRNFGSSLSTMGPAFFSAAEHRGLRNCNNISVNWSFFLQKRRHKSENWRKWNWKRKKKSVGEPHTPPFLDMLFSKIAFISNAVLILWMDFHRKNHNLQTFWRRRRQPYACLCDN